jgi:hypothetical protein
MGRGKVKNELGNKYGRLTVIAPSQKHDKSRFQFWKCQCSCGNIIEVASNSLRSGNTKSCGCLQRELVSARSRINLEGQRFGKLLVLRRGLDKKIKNKIYTQWLCRCDCGKETVVSTNSLRLGKTKSCGCLRHKIRSIGPRVNLEGQRFGKLLVLQITQNKNSKSKQIHWLCRCDCGKETIVSSHSLQAGITKSCGCLSHSRLNLEGQRFGKLLVLRRGPDKKIKNGIRTQWFCRCDCGKETVVSTNSLRLGQTKSCGCLSRLPEGEAAFNKCFNSLCQVAKRRKMSQELSKEQFRVLSTQPCYYCGKSPSNVSATKHKTSTFIYNGLDRVDNKIRAYAIDNVVPACKICNTAKGTLAFDEFRELVIRLYNILVIQACSPAFYATELRKIPDVKLPAKSWTCELIARWKSGAKKRNKSWQLTDAQAAWLSKQPCFYCGKEPFQLHNKTHAYMGIDRIDNTKGYQVDNVVPCCKNCNFAKLNRTLNQVKDWVTAVYLHWVLPNTTTTTTTTTTVTAADSQSPSKTALASVLPPS